MGIDIVQPEVQAPEGALVGDDSIEVRKPEPIAINEHAAAQVTGAPAKPVDTVAVNEVAIQLDRVITDPNSPEAVQIPDAGRGDASLPIHALAGPDVEDVFAAASKK